MPWPGLMETGGIRKIHFPKDRNWILLEAQRVVSCGGIKSSWRTALFKALAASTSVIRIFMFYLAQGYTRLLGILRVCNMYLWPCAGVGS